MHIDSPKFSSGSITYSNLHDDHPLRCPPSLFRPVLRSPERTLDKKLKLRDFDGNWGDRAMAQEKKDWEKLGKGVVEREKALLEMD